MATLTTYRLVNKYGIRFPIKQYVYGCPPVGEKSAMRGFKKLNSNTITILDDPISTGFTVKAGSKLFGLFKPETVKFLPEVGKDPITNHGIKQYIAKLKKLQTS